MEYSKEININNKNKHEIELVVDGKIEHVNYFIYKLTKNWLKYTALRRYHEKMAEWRSLRFTEKPLFNCISKEMMHEELPQFTTTDGGYVVTYDNYLLRQIELSLILLQKNQEISVYWTEYIHMLPSLVATPK